MNFYGGGKFKIDQSWDDKKKKNQPKTNARKSSQQGESLMRQLAGNLAEPSTDILDDSLSKLIMKDMEHPFNKPKSNKNMNHPQKPPTPSKNLRNSRQSIQSNKKNNNKDSGEDNDLLTSMASRLQKMQKTCQAQRQEIKEQRDQLDKVKTQNAFLKGMKQDSGKVYSQMTQIKQQNILFEKKVQQMQQYLSKHGLKWVGDKIEGNLNDKAIKKQIKDSKFHYRLPSEIDFSTIQRRILDLNSGLQEEGFGTEIYNQGGVHKFRKTQYLPMAFFANGIVIRGYNFFSYKSKQSLKILADLMDGYFPYVFKAKFPDGVLLQPIDKIAETYIQEKKDQQINTFGNIKDKQFQPQSKEQFLNKLPKQVIKNGKVINIRGQINKIFDGQSQSPPSENSIHFQQIDGILNIKTRCYKMKSEKLVEEEDICYLKIRGHDGKIFMVLMERKEFVKDVYKEVSKVMSGKFKVMSNFPQRIYEEDENQDLDALGFYPNANLHVQMIN